MKLSEIFGKKVLSTAGKVGYVISVSCDKNQLYFVCADVNEREFTVKWENVTEFGENIIFDGTESKENDLYPLRLGRACFDLRGNYLGKLEDCTIAGGKLKSAKIGKKNYPAEGLIAGDVTLVKDLRRLNADVVKDGKILFKKGTYVTEDILNEAAVCGEYVQTTLKSI